MTIKAKNSLCTLNVDFDTDAECRQALEELRWPDGVKWPALRLRQDFRASRRRKQYDCGKCRYRFSVTTGTVFNDSHLAAAQVVHGCVPDVRVEEGHQRLPASAHDGLSPKRRRGI